MAQRDDDLSEFEEDDEEERPDFTQSRRWRWVVITLSALFLLALILPVLLPACEAGEPPQPPPAPASTPSSVGVPDFSLSAADGSTVRLSETARAHDYVVLVFYRGFF